MWKLRIESYRYDGPHRNWNPGLHRIDPGHAHFDWRYTIRFHGLMIYRRDGFCSYTRAVASAEQAFPRVMARLVLISQDT